MSDSNCFLKNKQILFIGPVFFDYTQLIIEHLKNKGAYVHFINEKRIGFWENLLRRFSYSLCKIITNKLMLRELKHSPENIDIVFLIHGDLFDNILMNSLKKKYNSSIFIMYQWDSVINNKNIPFLSNYFDKVFSFDREDCKNYGFRYLPNFYIKKKSALKKNKNVYDLLFVGKGHTDRIEFLENIKKSVPKKFNIKYIIYLPWYRFLINFFLKKFKYLSRNDFTFKKISFNKLQSLISESKVILDIHNPYQNGLTQRPFDALARGKCLITTNNNIRCEPFYNNTFIQIVNRKDPIIDIKIFKTRDFSVPGFNEYSIENWSKKIFF